MTPLPWLFNIKQRRSGELWRWTSEPIRPPPRTIGGFPAQRRARYGLRITERPSTGGRAGTAHRNYQGGSDSITELTGSVAPRNQEARA
jgi:hypothetical protein